MSHTRFIGFQCFFLILSDRCLDSLRLLLNYGAQPDVHDANGFTALIIACKMSNIEVVKELIKSGCKVDKVTFRY